MSGTTDMQHTCTVHPPGSGACYTRHSCRCDPCRKVAARAKKRSRAGITDRVPTGPVRAHIHRLVAAGWSRDAIGKAAGLTHSHIRYIASTAARTHRTVAEAILAVTMPNTGKVDATGTVRRIQALVARGWSMADMSRQLGRHPSAVHNWSTRDVVQLATARTVRDLYDRLWDTPPPEGTPYERMIADRARRYAERRNWPPPMAWDDDTIDDPAATPDRGAPVRRGRGQPVEHLIEDVQWLADEGLTLQGVADRLGRKPKDLSTQLYRAKRADLAAQLLRNDRSRRVVA